ncbi:hypothetical protein C8R47DRAFT_1210028 [Mycena vitilis]|nr:hypothetical protein C8R47DRAFT_1230833 [Mycena vitilis]KAJ6457186.1 hypothetical protein C8R47DRAFT_1227519 [Mycena vitilis]KAJ6504779.1 hypothetical protein C8R47DRAFT_1210028 [Mycena vitilis]
MAEILHSGQYWQDVRRRTKEARAARLEREARAESFAPSLVDGTEVFTFVPGRAQPYTSVLHPSGRLLPVSGRAKSGMAAVQESREVARLAAERRKRRRAEEQATAERAKRLNEVLVPDLTWLAPSILAMSQRAVEKDTALLARLEAGRSQGGGEEQKKRKLVAEVKRARDSGSAPRSSRKLDSGSASRSGRKL